MEKLGNLCCYLHVFFEELVGPFWSGGTPNIYGEAWKFVLLLTCVF
jgi:hypothetical protein